MKCGECRYGADSGGLTCFLFKLDTVPDAEICYWMAIDLEHKAFKALAAHRKICLLCGLQDIGVDPCSKGFKIWYDYILAFNYAVTKEAEGFGESDEQRDANLLPV